MRGRIKRSPNTRTEQLRMSQSAYRTRMAEEGLVSLQAYVPRTLKKRLDSDARKRTESRAERLTEILKRQYPHSRGGRP